MRELPPACALSRNRRSHNDEVLKLKQELARLRQGGSLRDVSLAIQTSSRSSMNSTPPPSAMNSVREEGVESSATAAGVATFSNTAGAATSANAIGVGASTTVEQRLERMSRERRSIERNVSFAEVYDRAQRAATSTDSDREEDDTHRTV